MTRWRERPGREGAAGRWLPLFLGAALLALAVPMVSRAAAEPPAPFAPSALPAADAFDDRCDAPAVPLARTSPPAADDARSAGPASPMGAEPGTDPRTLQLLLNVPAMRLDLRRGDGIEHTFGVAVGMRRYPSPLGTFEITRIVWNPWWFPPESDWARDERVTAPGPGNPMGRVKIFFSGVYYLHGTPLPNSIGQAASHGCVRMRNDDAVALARLLQRETAAPISEAAVDSLTGPSYETREVHLPRRVPIRLVYELVELRRDTLYVHRDVYRRGGPTRQMALAVLARAGHDTAALRKQALDSLLRRGREGHAFAPASWLLNGE